jgi:hypothetical protein
MDKPRLYRKTGAWVFFQEPRQGGGLLSGAEIGGAGDILYPLYLAPPWELEPGHSTSLRRFASQTS